MTAPRLTVLMSVYNGASFVAAATESILAQTFTDFEFLVVDDGSTDGSGDIVASYGDPRVRLIRNRANLGLTRSLNIGLGAARGALIARQDADDVSRPERLARQVAFLDANPSVALVGARAEALNRAGKRKPLRGWPTPTGGLGIQWQLMFGSPFLHTSVMFRRGVVWDALGGYRETFRTSQDFELWSRLSLAHSMCNLPDVLVEFRVHDQSVSRGYRKDDVGRVRGVLLENRQRALASEALGHEGLDAWMVANNPRALGQPTDLASLARADAIMFRRFVAVHPAAAEDREIRRWRSISLARVACSGARQGARGALRLFAYACRLSPSVLASWSGRFTTLWMLGLPARVGCGRIVSPDADK